MLFQKTLRSALVVAALMPSVAFADPFDDGAKAFAKNDFKTAEKMWRPLAEQGNPKAQFNLGVLYASGNGVAQDNASAYLWFSLAASRATGDERADYLSYRDRVAPLLTPQQIADAQHRAREWQAAFEKRQAQQK